MSHVRRLPRIAPTGRITVRLTLAQRDLLLASTATPKELGHALHRVAVREGKLRVQLRRGELGALIVAAARTPTADRTAERALSTLLTYLESLDDRFAEPEESVE